MNPANSYAQILEHLTTSLARDFPDTSCSRLTGLLFAPPYSDVATKSVVPRLNNYHIRADHYIDFYCVGYGPNLSTDDYPDAVEVTKILGKPWSYSDLVFDEMRKQIEGLSEWKWSAEVDLILISAIWDAPNKKAELSFTDSLVLTPDLLLKDQAITSFPRLFEDIFRYAEQANQNLLLESKAKNFSNHKGKQALGRAALEHLFELLPSLCGKVWKSALHFRSINLNKGEMNIAERAMEYLKS